jgi:O-antigen/teichoic acid export membrane protein
MAAKKARMITKIAIVASIVNIILNVALLTTIGLIGAAIATVVAYALESTLYYYFSARQIAFDIRLDYLWRATVAALCMGAILSQLTIPSPEFALASKVILGIVIYGIVVFVLNGFSLPREAITFDT